MARLGRMAIAALALASGIGTAAGAQTWEPGVILSDDWGLIKQIGASGDLREGLDPVPVSGPDIVAEFKRLCLDTNFDAAAHAQAALGSTWRFRRHEVQLSDGGKPAPLGFADYRSASAITSLWNGEGGQELKGRAYQTRTRALIITGPVKLKDLYAPQCNLSLRTSGLRDAAALAAALEQALGGPAAKLVVKTGWADGNWKFAGPSGERRRVAFDVTGMKKESQLVHLTVQALPAPKP